MQYGYKLCDFIANKGNEGGSGREEVIDYFQSIIALRKPFLLSDYIFGSVVQAKIKVIKAKVHHYFSGNADRSNELLKRSILFLVQLYSTFLM